METSRTCDRPSAAQPVLRSDASLELVADHFLDTASQRSATGLDEGVRNLILGVLNANPARIVDALFEDTYDDYEDYVRAVSEVWGSDLAARIYQAVSDARFRDQMYLGKRANVAEAQARSLVLLMPEPDFRIAVLKHAKRRPAGFAEEERIDRICRSRGVPWTFTVVHGFEWVGDQEVETHAIRPALSAISDPRFSGGVKTEFDTARRELALGTPTALSQCVQQAGSAVESAMKVVLDECGIAHARGDASQRLFTILRDRGLVENNMERLILAAATPRNQLGGHGAGAVAHAVDVEVAEAVLASAAVSIAYLHTLLP